MNLFYQYLNFNQFVKGPCYAGLSFYGFTTFIFNTGERIKEESEMMKESEFYEILDKVERLNDATDGYYPTVEELKMHGIEESPTKFVPIIAYFSADPFNKQDIECKSSKDYLELVDYCKKLLPTIELEEENN